MPTSDDNRNAQSARVHIEAARAAPHRRLLELTQAENFAYLIADPALRKQVEREIRDEKFTL